MGNTIGFSKSAVRDMVRRFTKEHEPTTSICKSYGVSCNTVIRVLREAGVEVTLSKVRTKYFSPKQRARMVNLYDQGRGLSPSKISESFDCSYATIRRVLKEEGVYTSSPTPYNSVSIGEDTIARICLEYENGASAKSLAARFGFSQYSILKLLKSNGFDTNDYGRGERKTLIADTGLVRTCRSLSRRIYKDYKDMINPNGYIISPEGFHIDHKVSLNDGFRLNLTVLDLAHPCNLQAVTAKSNLSKYKHSDLTKRDLLRAIKSWNKELGDPFDSVNMEIEYTYRYGRYRYFGGEYRHFKVKHESSKS